MTNFCPYPDCPSFAQESGQPGSCLACGRLFTPRSALHFSEMEKKIVSTGRTAESLRLLPPIRPAAAGDMVVVVEDLRSLHNVGAIFRTADGAGFKHLYLCGITGLPPRKEIAKVSLGAEDTVPWEFYPFIAGCLHSLKDAGYQIICLEKDSQSQSLYKCLRDGQVQKPLALVVGNEVGGLSKEALHYSDLTCHLLMKGIKESLNVSVAFGAAAYLIAEYFDYL